MLGSLTALVGPSLDRLLGGLSVVPFVMATFVAPTASGTQVLVFRDPQIVEASALVVRDGLFETTNDSGDTGRVFTVDGTGRTVGVTYWNPDAVDVEALAPAGDGHVWVGDIGDNRAARPSVQVARIPVGRGTRTVEPTVYDLVYPDGSHDAETLMSDPATGRLYIATKGFLGGTLYAAPATLSADGPNRLEPVADVGAIATDGSFFPDGRNLVIRDYDSATVYQFPSMRAIGTFDLPEQQQGEGIAVDEAGRVYLDSEGQVSPVLEISLPRSIQAAVDSGSDATPSTDAAATPQAPSELSPGFGIDGWGVWVFWGVTFAGMVVVLVRALKPK